MTTKRIIYEHPDAGVAVIQPNEALRAKEESEDAFVARVLARLREKAAYTDKHGNVADPHLLAATPRVVDRADLPFDEHFRLAWRLVGDKVEIDMPAARDIHRDHIRARRKPLLTALDVEVSRALARGDQAAVAEAEARRQRLRDATTAPAIDTAPTPEALQQVDPLADA